MPEETDEAGIVYALFAELGLKITSLTPGYKWRDQAWVGSFETRREAVRAAFADALQAMKERDTLRRELAGLRAENEVARTTILRLSDIISSDATKEGEGESDDQEGRA